MGFRRDIGRGGKWMIRTYKSGQVVEKSKFWVPEQTRPRGKRTAVSSPRKRDENDRAAVKQCARLINCNMRPGDLWLTLSYSDAGLERLGPGDADEIRERADHQLELWIRRIRRRLGAELFYFAGTSDLDGETGELTRPHHHVLVPAWAAECVAQWKLGSVDIRHLRDQGDYTPIALYICRQCRRTANERRWKHSANLKKPEVYETESYEKAPLRPSPGARVLDQGRYCEESGNHYIRYIPKKREKRGGHKLPPEEGTGDGL